MLKNVSFLEVLPCALYCVQCDIPGMWLDNVAIVSFSGIYITTILKILTKY